MKNFIQFVFVLLLFGHKCLAQEPMSTLSICGTDDRVRKDDARICRFRRADGSSTGGTAWLASNGAIITAGHAMTFAPSYYIEFNIPSSLDWGGTVRASDEDQYQVDMSSIVGVNGGMGNDWKIFRCFPNPITGLLPHQAQNNFFRMTNENPSVNGIIRITGCGVDEGIDNKSVQTSSGPYLGETTVNSNCVYHKYEVDTESDNSGSPIIWNVNGFVIGIHTHSGCSENPPFSGNNGTSFENDGLEYALQNFYGTNTIYVDLISRSPNEDGTIFSPYNTVIEGINATPSGGKLFITTGTYNNNDNLIINKEICILPPACGAIIINP